MSYADAVVKFYGKSLDKLDKNLAISLGVFHERS
jgi:hypothetical protein